MIANEPQYRITLEKASNLEYAITKHKLDGDEREGTDPVLVRAEREGMESLLETLRGEIAEYERTCGPHPMLYMPTEKSPPKEVERWKDWHADRVAREDSVFEDRGYLRMRGMWNRRACKFRGKKDFWRADLCEAVLVRAAEYRKARVLKVEETLYGSKEKSA